MGDGFRLLITSSSVDLVSRQANGNYLNFRMKTAPPLLENSEVLTWPPNQTLSEFTRRGGWGVRSKRILPAHCFCLFV